MDDVNNILALAHEGSTAHSLAVSLDQVQISPSGDKGCFVGLPLKSMPDVTVSSIVGSKGQYKLLVEKADTVEATHEEWVEGGEKLLVKLHVAKKASSVVNELKEKGMDHHLLVKEGDHTAVMSAVCKYLVISSFFLSYFIRQKKVQQSHKLLYLFVLYHYLLYFRSEDHSVTFSIPRYLHVHWVKWAVWMM